MLLGVALAAGGCGDGQAQEPTDNTKAAGQQTETADPTDERTETPAATAPTKPETTADSQSPDQLPDPEVPNDPGERELYDASVRFFGAATEAMNTLSAAPFDDVIAPGSDAHTGYISRIDDMKADGEQFDEAPRFVIRGFESVPDNSTDQVKAVSFRTWSGPATILNQDNEPVDSLPGGTVDDEGQPTWMRLVKVAEGRWIVAQLRFD